jgi:hypothetical protein
MAYNPYTIQTINKFLFGNASAPSSPAQFVNENFIRSAEVTNPQVTVGLDWYMTSGPGRFGLAALSPIVFTFFEKNAFGEYVYDAPPSKGGRLHKARVGGIL